MYTYRSRQQGWGKESPGKCLCLTCSTWLPIVFKSNKKRPCSVVLVVFNFFENSLILHGVRANFVSGFFIKPHPVYIVDHESYMDNLTMLSLIVAADDRRAGPSGADDGESVGVTNSSTGVIIIIKPWSYAHRGGARTGYRKGLKVQAEIDEGKNVSLLCSISCFWRLLVSRSSDRQHFLSSGHWGSWDWHRVPKKYKLGHISSLTFPWLGPIFGLEGFLGQLQGANFTSRWATMLVLRLDCSTASLPTPQKALPNWYFHLDISQWSVRIGLKKNE